ncbi:MAG: glycosyltransferase family 2 protein [Termitinemataceae bacterium]|nr:MAG: glycosyltransferase family 2 protein [Termitinemataceae bacterium]
MKILIIIPAYNEAENIERVVSNIKDNFPQYDYVVINDCSTDDTEKICADNGYNYISLPVNLGIGGGVQTGYLYAHNNNYDVAVQFDGDGQHNPQYIERLLEPIKNAKADMVIGSRFIDKEGFQTSFMRRAGIGIIKLGIKLSCGADITDTTSGFRAANKELISLFAKDYAQDYPEPEAIVATVLNGYRVVEVPVIMNERTGGVSSINTLRSCYYMIKVSLALFIYRLSIKRVKKHE